MRTIFAGCASLVLGLASSGTMAQAQSSGGMDHSKHMGGAATTAAIPPGQDAYATIAAVVAMLQADSTTDWSKVNIEALRQHLIVMNDVTLGARSRLTPVDGGAAMDVTGEGRVTESIRSMLRNHSMMLVKEGPYRATVADIPGGVRWTVTAADPADAKTVAKIRGLGFGGLLTLGDHHTPHHRALARGEPMMHQER
jgi:hypothetical protein